MKFKEKIKENKYIRDDDKRLHSYFSEEYISFLEELNDKLTIPSMNGCEIFTNTSLKESELEHILEPFQDTKQNTVKKTHTFFRPYRACADSKIGFEIYLLPERRKNINRDRKKLVLRFLEEQLPKGYSFFTLEPYFNNPTNIEAGKEYFKEQLRTDIGYYDPSNQYKKRNQE